MRKSYATIHHTISQISWTVPNTCLPFKDVILVLVVNLHWKPYLLGSLPTTQLPGALHTSLNLSLPTPRTFTNSVSPDRSVQPQQLGHTQASANLLLGNTYDSQLADAQSPQA